MTFEHEPWRIPVHVDHHGRPDCPPACGFPYDPGPGTCHCGAPVAAVADPAQYAALGPAPYALCVRCLGARCDAHPDRRCPGLAALPTPEPDPNLSDYRRATREAAARRERRRRITSALARPTYYAACLFLLWLPTWSADHGHEPLRDHGARGLLIASAALASALVLLWHAPRKDNRP